MRPAPDVELSPVFPALDTLRLVGAMAVLTTHSTFQTGDYLGNGLWGTLLARLDVGVAIFFVLSGFLLSRPWFARAALGLPRPVTLRYFEKRALRIFPVYVVTVVVALSFVPGNEDLRPRDWASSLLMLDSYHLEALPHGLTHMWSLAAELAFYAILPALMLLALPRRRVAGLPLLLLVTTMASVSIGWHLWAEREIDARIEGSPGLWLPAYLTWFAAGIALAFAHVRVQQGTAPRLAERILDLGRLPGVCWTMAVGLLLVAATPLAGPALFAAPTPAESLTKHLLYSGIGGLVVLSGVSATSHGVFGRVLSHPWMRHLGHISYSIFSIHLAILALAFELTGWEPFTGHGLTIWLLTAGMTWVAAEVLYRFVELPGLRLKDAWRRREDAVSQATAPATGTRTR